jgi:hypothetical protein
MVASLLTVVAAVAEAKDPRDADLSKRQPSPSERRFPEPNVQSPKVIEGFTDKRFQTRKWEGGNMSRLNDRRSSIQVQETRPKNIIDKKTVEFRTVDRKMSPQDGRVAFVRNFDRVHENKMAPSMRDARVVNVRQAARPAPTNQEGGELTMRDANRFTFHRNSYEDGPLRVQPAASGERVRPLPP